MLIPQNTSRSVNLIRTVRAVRRACTRISVRVTTISEISGTTSVNFSWKSRWSVAHSLRIIILSSTRCMPGCTRSHGYLSDTVDTLAWSPSMNIFCSVLCFWQSCWINCCGWCSHISLLDCPLIRKPSGGVSDDGKPGIRSFILNPPRFCPEARRFLSIFLIFLFNTRKEQNQFIHFN